MNAETNNIIISIIELCKAYTVENTQMEVLKNINLEITTGQFVALCGQSGSGKTTLLNMISGIDKPTSGSIQVFNNDLTKQTEDFLADFRCNQVGMVFQAYNLVSTLTVAENIAFPMEWQKKSPSDIEKRIQDLLEKIGLKHRINHFPAQLSGGEQQRVAFARALSNNPPLFLADEPTGNLDTKNGQKIIGILKELKAERKTIIVSTHDEDIMRLADKKLFIDDGKLATQNE
jgi:putative ABC transport system ATP-binding protein